LSEEKGEQSENRYVQKKIYFRGDAQQGKEIEQGRSHSQADNQSSQEFSARVFIERNEFVQPEDIEDGKPGNIDQGERQKMSPKRAGGGVSARAQGQSQEQRQVKKYQVSQNKNRGSQIEH